MEPFKMSGREIDRLFAGAEPVETGMEDLHRFVGRVRSEFLSTDSELEERNLPALLEMVRRTDKGDLAARPASKVHGPGGIQASGLPKRRRRIVLETLFTSLIAKIAAGGVAVALAATGGLAATGNLPDEMQTGIAKAVAHIGVQIPEGGVDVSADVDGSTEGDLDASVDVDADLDVDVTGEDSGTPDPGEDSTGEEDGTKAPNPNAGFGQSVAADARDGGVNGQEIRERAHARNEQRKAARSTGEAAESGDQGSEEGSEESPAAGQRPSGAGSQGSAGLDRAAQTPARDHLPSQPGAPGAGRRPAGTPAN